MDDDKLLAALDRLHDDMREMIGLIRGNYQRGQRLYFVVIAVVLGLGVLWPWISEHMPR